MRILMQKKWGKSCTICIVCTKHQTIVLWKKTSIQSVVLPCTFSKLERLRHQRSSNLEKWSANNKEPLATFDGPVSAVSVQPETVWRA